MKSLVCAAILVGACGYPLAHAQDPYPVRPVKVIAPSAPGGGFDLVGRVLSQKLSEGLGQQFIVENRPGSGTLLGTQAVIRAPADGYTLLVGGLSNIALNMGMYREPGYDALTDLQPISLVTSHSYTLIGRKDLALNSFKEVVAFARAQPGKLNFATSGPGSGQYVGAAVMMNVLSLNMVGVPYKGAQPAYQDLLSGRVDLFYDNTTTAKPFIDSGRVKAFAISSRERSYGLPNVPSFVETGVFDWEMESWFGLFAPAKTPRPIIERLRAEIDKAMQNADVRNTLNQGSARTIRLSPTETQSFVRAEVQKWTALVRKAGVTAE